MGNEYGFFLRDEWEATRFLSINAGVRLSRFTQIGAYTNYRYDFNGNKADSTVYAPGETVQAYNGLEPRLNTRWQLNKSSSIKTSISRAYQYIHLLSNNGSTLPTDVWVPSTLRVKPQECWQYSIGYFKNLLDNKIETSVEVYYKSMKNQIEYRAGYTPNTLKDPELDYVFGKGEAYGAEFFINKTSTYNQLVPKNSYLSNFIFLGKAANFKSNFENKLMLIVVSIPIWWSSASINGSFSILTNSSDTA
jgi:hypothetical protein